MIRLIAFNYDVLKLLFLNNCVPTFIKILFKNIKKLQFTYVKDLKKLEIFKIVCIHNISWDFNITYIITLFFSVSMPRLRH